jgi:hypothetical protein
MVVTWTISQLYQRPRINDWFAQTAVVGTGMGRWACETGSRETRISDQRKRLREHVGSMESLDFWRPYSFSMRASFCIEGSSK